MTPRLVASALSVLILAACGSSAPVRETGPADSGKRTAEKTPTRKPNVVLKRGGGFYKDDGPGEEIPDGLDDVPDADPKWEPLHKPALKPYSVLGKDYVPNTEVRPYKARGIASWYGKKFHGQKTSIGEPYDMFGMTAAHTTLALPSYVRVTNVQTGKSVIVRVTDRGPFHADRVIDLSYTAAYKLGFINGGSGLVDVEAIIPGEPLTTSYAQVVPTAVAKPVADPIAQIAVREDKPEPTASEAVVKGTFLQLGAFSNVDNAENLRNHLTRELDWLNESMRVTSGGGMHRVHLGPYLSRANADKVAERIRSVLGYRPTVVVR